VLAAGLHQATVQGQWNESISSHCLRRHHQIKSEDRPVPSPAAGEAMV
jgi:hypothetical protein